MVLMVLTVFVSRIYRRLCKKSKLVVLEGIWVSPRIDMLYLGYDDDDQMKNIWG